MIENYFVVVISGVLLHHFAFYRFVFDGAERNILDSFYHTLKQYFWNVISILPMKRDLKDHSQ